MNRRRTDYSTWQVIFVVDMYRYDTNVLYNKRFVRWCVVSALIFSDPSCHQDRRPAPPDHNIIDR